MAIGLVISGLTHGSRPPRRLHASPGWLPIDEARPRGKGTGRPDLALGTHARTADIPKACPGGKAEVRGDRKTGPRKARGRATCQPGGPQRL
eukprot:495571-Prymnesium_polylepis.2